jgi:hypothetical protein
MVRKRIFAACLWKPAANRRVRGKAADHRDLARMMLYDRCFFVLGNNIQNNSRCTLISSFR